jgi:hypothetical protein
MASLATGTRRRRASLPCRVCRQTEQYRFLVKVSECNELGSLNRSIRIILERLYQWAFEIVLIAAENAFHGQYLKFGTLTKFGELAGLANFRDWLSLAS